MKTNLIVVYRLCMQEHNLYEGLVSLIKKWLNISFEYKSTYRIRIWYL